MESQSMRRRQTVLGEQLQMSGGNSQFLAVPTMSNAPAINAPATQAAGSNTSVGRHMRSFSRISARGVPAAGVGNTSASSLTVPGRSGGAADESNVSADNASIISAHGTGYDDFDSALASGSVDPVAYLSRALAGADPSDILKFGEKLRVQAQKAHESDQKKLQRSHKALSTVASSIVKLAPAVTELHKQVGDLSLVSDAMRQDAFSSQAAAGMGPGTGYGGFNSGANGADGTSSRRGSTASFTYDHDEALNGEDSGASGIGGPVPLDRRQSMLVLNPAWTNDLNDLYKRVDGVQRVLPPAPGRHLVHEEHNWSELNLVTEQPVRPVLIVILNDFLLVAAPKHGKFAHEYHLELEETLECSMDESNRVLRIGHGSTQVGLQAPSLSRLRVVYSELCKHMELAATRRRTNIRGSSRRSLRNPATTSAELISGNSAGGGSSGVGALIGRSRTTKSTYQHSRKVSHSSLASVPEISVEQRREAARIIADLDRSIAHRQWSHATKQCLEHEHDSIVGPLVAERRAKLIDFMLEELNDKRMGLTRDGKCKIVQHLSKLGRAHDAKHTLLDTAASDIESQARDVHFMGDVVNYISQMAAIYFQTIIATVHIYQKAFPKKEDSSFVVTWVKSQVDLYAAIFNRQLFRIAPEFRAYQKCREVSRLESSQLRELSLDMEFMLRYVWES